MKLSSLLRNRELILYAVSNVSLSAAGLLGSFVCARLLLPEELGAFQTALLLVTYLAFLPFGVLNGFNRDYPFLLGKGDESGAHRLARIGYSVARLAAGGAAAAALVQVAAVYRIGSSAPLIVAGLSVVPVAALSHVTNLQTAILTGQQKFNHISRAQYVAAIATLLLLVLVWKFGVYGQAARLAILAALPWFFYLSVTRESRPWLWDGNTLGSLIKRGLPILVTGYLYQVLSIADRTLVASLKGTEAVGHYALAGLAIAAVQSVYLPISVVTYSHANRAFGQSPVTSSLAAPLRRFLLLVTVTVLPTAALIYLSLPTIVPRVLPNYVEGIRAGQIACIAAVFVSYCGTGFVLNVTGHSLRYGLVMAVGLAAMFLIGFAGERESITLEKIAWLRVFVSLGVCMLLNAYLYWFFARGGISAHRNPDRG